MELEPMPFQRAFVGALGRIDDPVSRLAGSKGQLAANAEVEDRIYNGSRPILHWVQEN